MRATFLIADYTIIIDDSKIDYQSEKAQINAVKEDDEYTFDVISCAARPVEFSIVNQLSKLSKDEIREKCEIANQNKEMVVLSNNSNHLVLSPFVERFTYFGEEQAEVFTNEVIDICNSLNASSLRITQFCMLRSDNMPVYPQFKGILNALKNRENESTLKVVFFDVPHDHFYDLEILFGSFAQK
ncbi:MAG: hypothetical protein SNJ77_09245 [Cytophagales bacterium]